MEVDGFSLVLFGTGTIQISSIQKLWFIKPATKSTKKVHNKISTQYVVLSKTTTPHFKVNRKM